MQLMTRRARRLLAMKRAGANVFKGSKTGLKPPAMYGARSLGLAECHVRKLRCATSACLPGPRIERSTTLRLAMHRCDPLHECRAAGVAA